MITKCWANAKVVAILASALLAWTGCAPSEPLWPRAAVKGTILLNGQPLPKGTVMFCPIAETSGPKISVPVIGGQFEVAADAPDALKPVTGKHRIQIEATDESRPSVDDEDAVAKFVANPQRHTVLRVPPEFNEKSTLEADVTAEGPNDYQFDLKSRR